ncbi:ABC transporter substrate-binding protein [Enterococcus olivae]
MKKIVLSFILAGTLFLGGCGNTDEATSSSSEEITTVKIGVMPSTDNMPLIVAHEQGFDREHGVNIELETFKSAKDRDAAFQSGTVDGINSDLIAFSTYLQGGMDIQITSSTYGQFDLVASTEHQSLEELKDQEIIILKNQGPEYAAEAILAQAGLSTEDVRFIEVPQVPSRVELLQNQQAAAAILPEPFVTMTAAEGMHNLGSTREVGLNPFVLCFTTEVIDEKATALQGMYEAYNQAVTWMKEQDESEYIGLFVDKIGFPEAMIDQIIVPDYPQASQVTEEEVTQAFTWAKDKGLLNIEVEPKDVLSDVYFQ